MRYGDLFASIYLGMVDMVQGRVQGAIEWYKRARRATRDFFPFRSPAGDEQRRPRHRARSRAEPGKGDSAAQVAGIHRTAGNLERDLCGCGSRPRGTDVRAVRRQSRNRVPGPHGRGRPEDGRPEPGDLSIGAAGLLSGQGRPDRRGGAGLGLFGAVRRTRCGARASRCRWAACRRGKRPTGRPRRRRAGAGRCGGRATCRRSGAARRAVPMARVRPTTGIWRPPTRAWTRD